tara:strand:- start:340 stop:882 length:543 start_codon:yes stop_codon:yes gene_type:complete
MFNVPTYLIEQQILTAAASTITFDEITAQVAAITDWTPRHLYIRWNVRATSGTPNFRVRLNGDTASNYHIEDLDAYSTTTASLVETADHFGLPTNITSDANEFSSGFILFPDAFSTRSHKSAITLSGRVEDFVRTGTGRWANTSAITSLIMYVDSSTLVAGSTLDLAVVDESFNHSEQII